MNDTEILEKYGEIKLEFLNCYKNLFTYRSLNKKYEVYGTAEHKSEFKKEMTVRELWQELNSINFELL